MKQLFGAVIGFVLAIGTLSARADLTIEITQGMDNPTAIAVVPFSWRGPGARGEPAPAGS